MYSVGRYCLPRPMLLLACCLLLAPALYWAATHHHHLASDTFPSLTPWVDPDLPHRPVRRRRLSLRRAVPYPAATSAPWTQSSTACICTHAHDTHVRTLHDDTFCFSRSVRFIYLIASEQLYDWSLSCLFDGDDSPFATIPRGKHAIDAELSATIRDKVVNRLPAPILRTTCPPPNSLSLAPDVTINTSSINCLQLCLPDVRRRRLPPAQARLPAISPDARPSRLARPRPESLHCPGPHSLADFTSTTHNDAPERSTSSCRCFRSSKATSS